MCASVVYIYDRDRLLPEGAHTQHICLTSRFFIPPISPVTGLVWSGGAFCILSARCTAVAPGFGKSLNWLGLLCCATKAAAAATAGSGVTEGS